jgi:hypothetical protein
VPIRNTQPKDPKVVTDASHRRFPVPDLANAASPLSNCQKLQSFDAARAQQWLICR